MSQAVVHGVDPRVGGTGSPEQRSAESLAALDRRVSALEAVRTAIGQGTLTGAQISNGTITGTQIAASSISAAQIQAGAISALHIQANAITAGAIAAGAVVAGTLAAGAVTAGTISAGAIQAGDLGANSVLAQNIVAGAVTSDKINVSALSAITTNMGSISAGTITGGTIQSGTTGARWVGDGSGLRGYALDGITKTFEINLGTGIASFTGIANLDPTSVIPGGALASVAFGGNNLLKNAGFSSSGGLSPWNLYQSTHQINSAGGAIGNLHYLRLISTGQARTGVSQNVSGIRGNTKYMPSVYGWSPGTGRTVTIWVDWRDANGALVGSASTYTSSAATAAWTRFSPSTPFTSPSSAVEAVFYVWFDNSPSGEPNFLSNAQFEQGELRTAWSPRVDEILPGTVGNVELAAEAVTAAKIAVGTITGNKLEAGTITALQIAAGTITGNEIQAGTITGQHLTLEFGGTNRVNNAAFVNTDTAAHGWSGPFEATTAVITAPAGVVPIWGTNVLRVTQSGTTPNNPHLYSNAFVLEEGQEVTASAWMQPSNPASLRTVRVGLFFWDSVGTVLDHEFVDMSVTGAGWKRPVVTAAAPAGTATCRMYFQILAVSTAGEQWLVGAMQAEYGDTATSFAPRPDEILPGSVGNTQLTPDSVTTDKILAGTILGTDISGTTITGTNIAATTIGAEKLNVATLSAITANMGSLTAGTITGGTIQTAAPGNDRVELSTSGLRKILADNSTVPVQIGPADGLWLLVGDNATPPWDRQITWKQGSSNVGILKSYDAGFGAVVTYMGTAKSSQAAYISTAAGNGESISASTTSHARVIINDAEQSGFLQVGSPTGRRKFATGTANATFSANNSVVVGPISHGLGASPLVWITSQNIRMGASQSTTDSTQFWFEAWTTAGGNATGTFTFRWLAIC